MRILCGTNWISEDEPCVEMYEQDVQSPDYSGFRRYRVYRVMRSSKVTEFREDMGSSERYRGIEPIVMLGAVIDGNRMEIFETVGSMRDMLDKYRNHVRLDKLDLVGIDKANFR